MFALLFTYIAGLLIIISSYVAEPILGCLHRRRRYGTYKHLEWITNSALQQQRLVHEMAGSEDWQKCTSDVPVTDAKLKLQCLDLSSLDHPRMLISKKEASQPVSEDRHQEIISTGSRDSQIVFSGQDEIGADQTASSSVYSLTYMSENSDGRSNLSPLDSSATQPNTEMGLTEEARQRVLDASMEETLVIEELHRGDLEADGGPETMRIHNGH